MIASVDCYSVVLLTIAEIPLDRVKTFVDIYIADPHVRQGEGNKEGSQKGGQEEGPGEEVMSATMVHSALMTK